MTKEELQAIQARAKRGQELAEEIEHIQATIGKLQSLHVGPWRDPESTKYLSCLPLSYASMRMSSADHKVWAEVRCTAAMRDYVIAWLMTELDRLHEEISAL